ncbi:MAG: DUF4157 domain-containing protein [Desulfobacterales bacterium]|nr:DUF4157 domain-containing protein [Desulfobacterales bacterium]
MRKRANAIAAGPNAPLQRQPEEELKQRKEAARRAPREYAGTPPAPPPVQRSENTTGMPDHVKERAENSFNADFSGVKIHANSSKAPSVGAVAYTQGADIHFAPGAFTPGTAAGQRLLGHELAHVVQQSEGRVQPTIEVNGMPVNDSPALEREADLMGGKI